MTAPTTSSPRPHRPEPIHGIRRVARSRVSRFIIVPITIGQLMAGCYKWAPQAGLAPLPDRARVTYRDPVDPAIERTLALKDIRVFGDSLYGRTYQPDRRFEDEMESERRVAIPKADIVGFEARKLDGIATAFTILIPITAIAVGVVVFASTACIGLGPC